MKPKYIAAFSVERSGWCVFRVVGDLVMGFHAGSFSERAVAESEADRLNEILPNTQTNEVRGSH